MATVPLSRFFPNLKPLLAESSMVSLPVYCIDGNRISDWRENTGPDGETYLSCPDWPGGTLRIETSKSSDEAVTRFRFVLDGPGKLTKPNGVDELEYLGVRLEGTDLRITETVLSNYDHFYNQYRPSTRVIPQAEGYLGQRFSGPIMTVGTSLGVVGFAVEHGGDHPNPFLTFEGDQGFLTLKALSGNYLDGTPARHESPWIILVVGDDEDEVNRRLRRFLLRDHGPAASREPFIFYNTWNHQERVKYLKKQPYLSEMNLGRMLAEIDVAHEIGIEVFVIDTGWYQKTGDWEVDLGRFPDGLQQVRAKLDQYGMQLGLWFNPVVAAKTSRAYLEHPEWVLEKKGVPDEWGPIWETEDSVGMCLCSDWADAFADTLIRLHAELGVTYFKWDAVGQWGCDSAKHQHGDESHSREERAANYAFESGRRLTYIADKVSRAIPGAIVDFDVTEGGRYFGLGFLSAGKFFSVNNGPYYANFDIPKDFVRDPDTINVFFFPGPARPRVCRGGYRFDTVVPSGLYLTHYLPDGDLRALQNSFASLVLGGNGIWGSLPELTREERAFWIEALTRYKKVRDVVTKAYPRVVGEPGLSPEIHEKIDPKTGVGMVVFFNVRPGVFAHVTQELAVAPTHVEGAKSWQMLESNRLLIEVELGSMGAAVVTLT